MAVTQAQRDALAAAVYSGLLSFTLAGENVTYQSLEQMREALAAADRELAAAAGTGQPYRLAATSKGA
jgi:hypothetical protein